MDITPLLELRKQLRRTMISGAGSAFDNFRLKKSVEAFERIRSASPVFETVYELSGRLVSEENEDRSGLLLEAATLVDSVARALAKTDIQGAVEDIPITEFKAAINDIPYSKLADILRDPEESWSFAATDIILSEKGILEDYRVKPALIRASGHWYNILGNPLSEVFEEMDDIVPLMKKDFSLKSDREQAKIIQIIEHLCGSAENGFYLEQLESPGASESNARKAAVYALRLDSNNAKTLLKLIKTEKGGIRETARYALAKLDCEEAKWYFTRLAGENPDDASEYMSGAVSQWSGRLTARLLDKMFTDENGNRLAIGSVEIGKARDAVNTPQNMIGLATLDALAGQLYISRVANALLGKHGAEIEAFYRTAIYPTVPYYLDEALGNTIVLTNDSGLKKLAFELNKKEHGGFIYSKTMARLFGEEDCTDWLEEKLIDNKKRFSYSQNYMQDVLTAILQRIRYKNGKYGIVLSISDPAREDPVIFFREIPQPVMPKFVDLFIRLDEWTLDEIMTKFYTHDDPEFTKKLKARFIKKSLDPRDCGTYFRLMNLCGFQNIDGLAARYFRKNKNEYPAYFFKSVPGTDEYKLSEARELIRLIRGGKLKCGFDVDKFERWAEKRFDSALIKF